MDALIDRLRLLNYSARFCVARNMTPIDLNLFTQAYPNPSYQIAYFYALLSWLAESSGDAFAVPNDLDDPNVTATNAVNMLKDLGIELTTIKLLQGYGDTVIAALVAMSDRALKSKGVAFKKPVFDKNEDYEEAESDERAEVKMDDEQEIIEEDEMPLYTDADEHAIEQQQGIETVPPPTSPQRHSKPRFEILRSCTDLTSDWSGEVDGARLKIHLSNDHKNWRMHVSSVREYRSALVNDVPSLVSQLVSDLDAGLEKLRARESYVNDQLDPIVSEYRAVAARLSQLRLEYTACSSTLSEIGHEYAQVCDEVEAVKSRMDELGSGMTDSKPLLNIKACLQKLKADMKQMHVRAGVLEHQLLHNRIKHKTRQIKDGLSVGNFGYMADDMDSNDLIDFSFITNAPEVGF